MILVDTSVWIDLLEGADSVHRHAIHRLIADERDVAIADIALTEVLQGIGDEQVFRATKRYLLEFPIYRPNGVDTYVSAAQIYRDCRKSGRTVRSTVNCIIAAICLENDLTLLHRDRDFGAIEACTGLKCYRL